MVVLQLGILLLSTCFVFISPGDQGLIERFGRPLAERSVLEPGVHLKMPWPIDDVQRFRTREIQIVNVGFVAEEGEGDGHDKAVLWTGKHYKDESNWLIASRGGRTAGSTNGPADGGIPSDLINVTVPVQFQIQDLRAWAYNHADAAMLLEKVATREVVRYLAGTDLFELMASGRSQASEELRKRIQDQADQLKMGVDVVFVGLQDLHPPSKVAPKFQELVATGQENEAKKHQANGYALSTVNLAKGNAERLLNEAQAYSNRTVMSASAIGAQFTNRVVAYRASPQVYMQRAYLKALETGLTNSRKYVLATTTTLIQYNLEDKIRGDLINDLTIPAKK